ncbi:MAG: YggS family pyridoxal phosphate-dependent enzyme [Clostridiales bacterium]|nr:YggS family pyridoxal phosphate-dependent enzyme [Clostridiales bacterium]
MRFDEHTETLISERLNQIKDRIGEAAASSGRDPSEIILIAATKTQNDDVIKTALNTGKINAAGENRVQEFQNHLETGAYLNYPVHFIGHLQTNKLKFVVGKVALIHSVDSIHLAKEIAKQASKMSITQDVLLEINTAREDSKFGFLLEELPQVISEIAILKNIRIRGIMAIPPKQEESGQNIPYFERLRQVFIDIKTKKYDNVCMDYLSMGMSDDYFDAIICGSNMVRLGTALFGKREA